MIRLLAIIFVFLNFFIEPLVAQNQLPEIVNLTFEDDAVNKELTINFDVIDSDNDQVNISLQARAQSRSQIFFPKEVSGDVGKLFVGSGKTIKWNYQSEFESIEDFYVKLMVDDGEEVNIEEMVKQVSQSNLESWLAFMAKPRSIKFAPAHLDAVRDSLYDYFIEQNLATTKQPFKIIANDAANVLAEKSGHVFPNEIYVVDAHFDGKDNAPGADDNASGTAGVLEAARVLAQYSFKKSIYFIGFDQEENALTGSREFVFGERKPWENYLGVLNLEMIGYYSEEENSQEIPTGFDLVFPDLYQEQLENGFRGDFILAAFNDFSENLGKAYIDALDEYVPTLKNLDILLPNGLGVFGINFLRSDHANFWAAKIPALLITNGSEFRNPNYHTIKDVVSTINFDFMTNVVKGTVAALAELAEPIHGSEVHFRIEKEVVSSVPPDEIACDLQYNYNAEEGILELNLNACRQQMNIEKINVYSVSGQLIQSKSYTFESNLTFNIQQKGIFIVAFEGHGRTSHKKIALH